MFDFFFGNVRGSLGNLLFFLEALSDNEVTMFLLCKGSGISALRAVFGDISFVVKLLLRCFPNYRLLSLLLIGDASLTIQGHCIFMSVG